MCAGGVDAPFLTELDGWGKTLRLRRDIPSDLLRHLANCMELTEYPLIVVAMLKKAMGCHIKYVQNDKAKIFGAHDIASLGKATAQLKSAHRMQQQARTFLESTGLPRMQYEFILGMLDVRIVTLLTKKNEPGRQIFDSFQDIGSAFVNELREKFSAVLAGRKIPFATVAKPAQEAAPAKDKRMREIQATGSVTRAAAESQGFIVGVEITHSEGACFVVDELHETHVMIKPPDAKTARARVKLTYNTLLANYKLKPEVNEAFLSL